MIRSVQPNDAAAICAIYNHYVLHTTISFEEEAVSTEAMAQRIAAATLPWLVLEEQGEPLGYAYASPWRVRAAYRHAVEISVYLAPGATGRRLGQTLCRHLLHALRQRDVHCVIGGIAQPNPASVALHQRLGFRKVAHFEQVGWKHGRWVDVGYWQLILTEEDDLAAIVEGGQ
ncbi:MAG: arsinothricin resistance N-acetyltransferase ArsN1 family B [Pseudomonadota bacterium]